jgi:hypothetical protein
LSGIYSIGEQDTTNHAKLFQIEFLGAAGMIVRETNEPIEILAP